MACFILLAHISLVSVWGDLGNQCRHRPTASEQGTHCLHNLLFIEKKTPQTEMEIERSK